VSKGNARREKRFEPSLRVGGENDPSQSAACMEHHGRPLFRLEGWASGVFSGIPAGSPRAPC